MVVDFLTITKKLKSSRPNFDKLYSNFISGKLK